MFKADSPGIHINWRSKILKLLSKITTELAIQNFQRHIMIKHCKNIIFDH